MTIRGRFWRNVTLIAVAHVALLIVLLRWAGETKAASAPEITWLSGGAEAESIKMDDTTEASPGESIPDPDETTMPATKSEIILPSPTPAVTPRSTPKKTEPSATPRSAPRKKAAPKPTATPGSNVSSKKRGQVEKKSSTAASADRGRAMSKNESGAKQSTGGSGDGANGPGSGKGDAATANYYGNMLHDRFYRAWNQPQTVVASGVKLSAVARIRIEKDGRISNFKLVKSSGNVLVDESVQSAGKKVSQVDALPAGVGSGGHYDLNINFALNSE